MNVRHTIIDNRCIAHVNCNRINEGMSSSTSPVGSPFFSGDDTFSPWFPHLGIDSGAKQLMKSDNSPGRKTCSEYNFKQIGSTEFHANARC